MPTTALQYAQRLGRRLADEQVDGFFATSTLEEFGSEAQRDIAMRIRPFLLLELQTIHTGTVSADSEFNVTADVGQIMSLVLYNATNMDTEVQLLGGGNLRVFRGVNTFFKADDSTPIAFVENAKFVIEPNKSGLKHKLRYVKIPIDISGGTTMVLSDRWEDLALDYGAILALQREKRMDEAEALKQKYLEKIEKVNGGGV